MQIPLKITYVRMHASDDIDARIEKYVAQLEKRFGRIMSCRVVVEAPHRHHRKGKLYHVRVDLTLPRGEIIVSHEHPLDKAHEDVLVTIRDAFRAVRRRLEEHARRHRGRVKKHEVCPHGKIIELHWGKDYGTIETPDGHTVYFHRNSVINANFDEMKVGDEVRFDVEQGNAGPQASTVHLIGKHHIVAA